MESNMRKSSSLQGDLFYIPECAKRLGKTDAAIRSMINRKSKAIPPFVRLPNGKIAWRERDYAQWLNNLSQESFSKGSSVKTVGKRAAL
jgi:predicted DNA-binding transcriptional regulator AlpA